MVKVGDWVEYNGNGVSFYGIVKSIGFSYLSIEITKQVKGTRIGTTHYAVPVQSVGYSLKKIDVNLHQDLSVGQAIHFRGAMTDYQGVILDVKKTHYTVVVLKVFKAVYLEERDALNIPRNSPCITPIQMPETILTASGHNEEMSIDIMFKVRKKQEELSPKWDKEHDAAYKANMFELYWLTKDKQYLEGCKG